MNNVSLGLLSSNPVLTTRIPSPTPLHWPTDNGDRVLLKHLKANAPNVSGRSVRSSRISEASWFDAEQSVVPAYLQMVDDRLVRSTRYNKAVNIHDYPCVAI